MKWEDVLQRDDIVGGDLETQEDGRVYRGPISSIRIEGEMVYFRSPWTARMNADGTWEKWHITGCGTNTKMCPPNDIGEGRVQFSMPMLGFGVIFPKGGSKLDPSKVKGLDLATV